MCIVAINSNLHLFSMYASHWYLQIDRCRWLLYDYGLFKWFNNFLVLNYFSNKCGYAVYAEWKRLWSRNGTSEANIKLFFSDKYLPYWVQCNTCKKWREVPRDTAFTSQFVKDYVCQSQLKASYSSLFQLFDS